MLDGEFLEHVADFYGGVSVDELAERLDVSTAELMEELEALIDANLDLIMEEMEYLPDEDEDVIDGED